MRQDEQEGIPQDAEQARFLVEVTRQRVRIAKTQLEKARQLYKEAKREAKRARRKATSAQRTWRQVRKQMGRKAARAAKRKAKRKVVLHRARSSVRRRTRQRR